MRNRLVIGMLAVTMGVGAYFIKEGVEKYQIYESIDKVAEADTGNNFSREGLSEIVEEDIDRISEDSLLESSYFDIFESYAGELSKIDPEKKGKQEFDQDVNLYNKVSQLLNKIESQDLQDTKLGIKIKREKRDVVYGIVSRMKHMIDNCHSHFDIMSSGENCLGKTGDSEDKAMERVACLLEQRRRMQNYCRSKGIWEISKINPEFREMYDTALVIALDNGMTL